MLEINIPSSWDIINMLKQKVQEELKNYDQALIEAAVMTISELAENAIKYGCKKNGKQMSAKMQETESEIFIAVSNGICCKEDLENVKKSIEKLKSSSNPEQLYVARLEELMAGKTEGSQLGLLRIAYEGKFSLDYTFTDDILTIEATRSI